MPEKFGCAGGHVHLFQSRYTDMDLWISAVTLLPVGIGLAWTTLSIFGRLLATSRRHRDRRRYYERLRGVRSQPLPGPDARADYLCRSLPGRRHALVLRRKDGRLRFLHTSESSRRWFESRAPRLRNWLQRMHSCGLDAAVIRRAIDAESSTFRDWRAMLSRSRTRGALSVCLAAAAELDPRLHLIAVCAEDEFTPDQDRLLAGVRAFARRLAELPDRRGLQLFEEESTATARELHEMRRRYESRERSLVRITHDIRMPLAHLFLSYENMELLVGELRPSRTEHAQGIERLLERIKKQLHVLEHFTHDLLQLETGRINPEDTDRFSVRECIDEVLGIHEELLERRRIELHYELRGETEPICLSNRTALSRILFNLISNAVKFSSSPGRLYVSVSPRHRHVIVDVEDSGTGLVSRENSFEVSEQNIGRAGGGWGIGLASARDLSRRIGGRLLAARPLHGSGARFLLVLPAPE